MKLTPRLIFLWLILACAPIACIVNGCKAPNLESGGNYATTNSVGVVTKDAGLFLADSGYKLAYDSIQTVFAFERNNRAELWAMSHNIKSGLDKARGEVNHIEKRWASARKAYREAPSPQGLDQLHVILADLQKVVAIVQSQVVTPKP